MRLSTLAIAGIFFVMPIAAHANGVSFGSANCDGTVTCSPVSTPDSTDVAAINAIAGSCVSEHFGFRGSPFDPSLGLDSSQCLQNAATTSSGQTTGLTMSAHCCIIQGTDDTCHIRCTLAGSN
jgi:hypothetical protein